MCACSTNEIKFRLSFRTILARGTRSRVPRCIPSGAWRGSFGRAVIERHASGRVPAPRHPMTKGASGAPLDPIEQDGAVRAPPVPPSTKGRSCPLGPRLTLRGLDARQPHRGWIATGGDFALPRTHREGRRLRCSPLQPPSGKGASPLCNPGPPTHPCRSRIGIIPSRSGPDTNRKSSLGADHQVGVEWCRVWENQPCVRHCASLSAKSLHPPLRARR